MAKFDFSNLEDRNKLLGDLGETFYKHFSDQSGYAYCRAEDIGWELIHKNVIRFKKGFDRIEVRIPQELRRLLMEIIGPNPNYPQSPAYSFDFISCLIASDETKGLGLNEIVENKATSKFTIVEVKTGQSALTSREEEIRKLCVQTGVRYRINRIRHIDRPVSEWDFRIED